MKRAILLLLFAALPLSASDRIFDSVVGHDCFRALLQKNGWGLAGPYERAEFILQQDDGSLTCQEWPSIHSYLGEQFHGVVPPHTIAIAHTHPAQFPLPSEHDNDEAVRLGLPVYTISIRGVYKSIPGAARAEVITSQQSWIRETPPAAMASAKAASGSAR
jgi:hypothetical protein